MIEQGVNEDVRSNEELKKEIKKLTNSLEFYKDRCNQFQKWQSKLKDPERKILCDILANGYTNYKDTTPQFDHGGMTYPFEAVDDIKQRTIDKAIALERERWAKTLEGFISVEGFLCVDQDYPVVLVPELEHVINVLKKQEQTKNLQRCNHVGCENVAIWHFEGQWPTCDDHVDEAEKTLRENVRLTISRSLIDNEHTVIK